APDAPARPGGGARGGAPARPADPVVHRRVGSDRGGDPDRYLGRRGVGAAVFHAVDDGAAVVLLVLEPVDDRFDVPEPGVDALPAGRDEVDEQGQVVDARVAFGEQVALERRKPSKHLVHQAADLGEIAADRLRLAAYRLLHLARQRLLERSRCGGKRLDLLACSDEEGVQRRPVRALLDPLLCALDRGVVHALGGYRWRRVTTRELEYDLPPELIAQHPVARRDESRLVVYDRVSERVDHRRFAEVPDVIGDALAVVNDTRVVPARIPIERPRGEVLLLERLGEVGLWEGLARPTRRLRAGQRYGPVELLE